jgi:thiol-disulfide isomerase/thioredoxin
MVRYAVATLVLLASLPVSKALGEQVMLDFWSPTCGPCMQMKPKVESLINAGYPIRQVDVSRESQLAQQFRVSGIPCFVMLEDGQEVGRIVGATSTEQLVTLFRPGRVRGQSQDNKQPAPSPAQPSFEPRGPVAQPEAATPPTFPQNPPVAQGPSDENGWTQQFDNKLLSSTVRLKVEDANGLSHGTGTIVDAREGEALVITCGHLFRESKGKGPVAIEVYESGPEGLRVVATLTGEVVTYDLDRDVALVSFRPNHPVCVAQVAPPRTPISRGDRAASVGCSNGQNPTVMATRVTDLDRYQGPPNIETSGAPVEGRSGGGLFNDKGELVGVCFAADYEGNRGLYAGLNSIHEVLAELKGLNISGHVAATTDAAAVIRGQEPPATLSEVAATDTSPTNDDQSQPLDAHESATWEEIKKRIAAGYEVVCIVRPKEPGGQSEVITLDGVSSQFIRELGELPQKSATITK